MGIPTKNHNHLWNDMPKEERERLMPHAIESQLLHIWQCKQKAIQSHNRHMKELNEWMENINSELSKLNKATKD